MGEQLLHATLAAGIGKLIAVPATAALPIVEVAWRCCLAHSVRL